MMYRLQSNPNTEVPSITIGFSTTVKLKMRLVASRKSSRVTTQIMATLMSAPNGCTF